VTAFLLRLIEPGREAQRVRRKTRRDVVSRIAARLPGASTTTWPGRVVITAGGSEAVVRDLHGVLSYSPGRYGAVADLEAAAIAEARGHLDGAASFRVRARVRDSELSTRALEKAIGATLLAEAPELAVDLEEPDMTVGVEVHGAEGFVFCRTEPGLDHRPAGGAAEPGELSFLVDHMLGTIVGWLRLLGYDTTFAGDEADSELLRRARRDGRVILTRDAPLARATSARVYFVDAADPAKQLAEIAAAFGLAIDRHRAFTRCGGCNDPVTEAPEPLLAALAAEIRASYDRFTYCARCDKIFWAGPQYHEIVKTLEAALRD
jgi:uncharacterized protein with PIN domain